MSSKHVKREVLLKLVGDQDDFKHDFKALVYELMPQGNSEEWFIKMHMKSFTLNRDSILPLM